MSDKEMAELLLCQMIRRDNPPATLEHAEMILDYYGNIAWTHGMNGLSMDTQDLAFTQMVFNGFENNT